ncbi:MAG: T9SS type A sorting domain-containing protein [bacterium]
MLKLSARISLIWMIGVVLCGGVRVNPAHSQLRLLSTSPSDGATNVDTLATFVFVFSAPLDTTARFEEPQDFYLGVEAFPGDSVGEPEDIIVSSSLDTVTVKNISLTPDTKILIFLQGAKSLTGEFLDRPYAITFSTGSALPSGSVSGTINFTGGDAGGTAVGLFTELPFGGDGEDDGGGELEAAAVVPLAAGNYTANYVPAGTYYALAFKDINQDGIFDFPDDAFGGYDANNDLLLDVLTISEGETRTGVDMTVSISAPTKARQNFTAAENLIRASYPDAWLTGVSGDGISLAGESRGWSYIFYSASQDTIAMVSKLGNVFFVVPIPADSSDDGPGLILPLPENWIDSDVAVDSAEANGGSDFRDQYPDAELSAFAGVFVMPQNGGTILTNHFDRPRLARILPREMFEKQLPDHYLYQMAEDDTLKAWVLFYFSELAQTEHMVLLDVETGQPVGGPGPVAEPSTAQANLQAANQAAQAWAADANLLMIIGRYVLPPSGISEGWSFIYYSTNIDSARVFIAVEGNVAGEEPFLHTIPSFTPLPANWIDSPAAMAVAELNGGSQFRNANQITRIDVHLSRGLYDLQPATAFWWFEYFSSTAPTFEIFVNAVTGEFIPVSVEFAPENNPIPRDYALSQNFPNPFNPETVIEYQLPQNGQVELVILNLLGQKIRELVNEHKPAGIYKIKWDAKDQYGNAAGTGIYFYQLKAGERVLTKKLLLIR